MTQKIDLFREVYRLKNLLAEVQGKEPIDMIEFEKTYRFREELKASRIYDLREQIERLKKEYKITIEAMERDARTSAYYATPEGHAHKVHIEEAILQIQKDWRLTLRQDALHIDQQIQKYLGVHWGVVSYHSGDLCIGVIDVKKSTPQRRESYFGQDIDIYYNEKSFPTGESRFDTNCCTAGGFSMEGGQTVGERAMFYVGFGQLLANSSLVNDIKLTMAQTVQNNRLFNEKLAELKNQLTDPLKNKQNTFADNRLDPIDKTQNKSNKYKRGPSL